MSEQPENDREPRRDEWFVRAWIAPALLVVVASVQLVASSTTELSRWRAGGFGMYSTYHPNMRRIWLTRPGHVALPVEDWERVYRLPVTCPLARRAERCERWPTRACLEGLAACVAPQVRQGAPPGGERPAIEVWEPRFDPETGELRRRRIARVTF